MRIKSFLKTLELDRAVQSEIARAFGELIGGIKSGARTTNQYAEVDIYFAFIRVRQILHTAFGNRIPDDMIIDNIPTALENTKT